MALQQRLPDQIPGRNPLPLVLAQTALFTLRGPKLSIVTACIFYRRTLRVFLSEVHNETVWRDLAHRLRCCFARVSSCRSDNHCFAGSTAANF